MALDVQQDKASAPYPAEARGPLTVGLILVVTLVGFEALAVATVMPAVQESLGQLKLYGWAFSAFLTTSILGVVVAGEQCDRRGAARPFIVALALFALGLVIAGTANSMAMLVVGRAVQGLGGGGIPAIAYVAIGRGYPEEARPRMFALMSSAWVIPSLLGPAAAGAIADAVSWRLVFLGLLPVLLVAFMLAYPPLRRLGAPHGAVIQRSRAPSALRLVIGFGVAQAGLTVGVWWLAVPLLGVGIAVAVSPLLELLPKGTLRARRGLPAAILGMGMLNFAFFGAEAFVPFMLTNVRGISVFEAGTTLTIAGLSWTIGAWVQVRAHRQWARPLMIRTGFVFVAIGVVTAPAVLLAGVPVWVVALSWAVAGMGMGLAYPSFSILMLSVAPAGEEGTTTSSFKFAELLSAAVAAALAGALVAAGESTEALRPALLVVFVMAAAVAFAAIALTPRLPSGKKE